MRNKFGALAMQCRSFQARQKLLYNFVRVWGADKGSRQDLLIPIRITQPQTAAKRFLPIRTVIREAKNIRHMEADLLFNGGLFSN